MNVIVVVESLIGRFPIHLGLPVGREDGGGLAMWSRAHLAVKTVFLSQLEEETETRISRPGHENC